MCWGLIIKALCLVGSNHRYYELRKYVYVIYNSMLGIAVTKHTHNLNNKVL